MREKDLEAFTVKITDSLRTAMVKITANRCRAVVVLDGQKVVGVVSDGDIRRAFLKDVLPMARVETVMNINCVTTTERAPEKLAAITRREKITLLPIVDDDNELVDVFLAYEPVFGQENRPGSEA